MTISSAVNSTANSYVKTTAPSTAKSTAAPNTPASSASTTTSDVSSTSSAFGEMVTQASLSSVPSKTLSPEVIAATVPSTTIQTSGYVFDPLGVVGTVPESNTFLQAIRQMMGKPLGAPSTDQAAPATAAASPATTTSTAAALTPFGNLPAATTSMPTASTMQSSPTSLPTTQQEVQGSSQAGTSSVADFMSSIEAQLSYQGNVTEAKASPAEATTFASIVEAATTAAQSVMAGDLVDQYLADASAAVSANAQSDLASAVDKEDQAA